MSAAGISLLCYCGERFDNHHRAWLHIRAGCEAAQKRILASMRRRDGRRLVAECGTVAGYKRHRYLGEPYCSACRAAKAIRDRERMREQRSDPEQRKRLNDRLNAWENKRMSDPEYRERRNAQRRVRDRERRASDPEYRERMNARKRERRARLRQERGT